MMSVRIAVACRVCLKSVGADMGACGGELTAIAALAETTLPWLSLVVRSS